MKHFGLHFLILVGLWSSGCAATSTTYPATTSTPSVHHSEFAAGDCQTLDMATWARLDAKFNDVIKPTGEPNTDPFHLWNVWKCEAAGNRIRYILFEGQPLVMIPSASHARIALLDEQWRVVNTTTFSTGWRMDLEGAELKYDPALSVPVIEVRSSVRGNKDNIAVQDYGIVNDEITRLRLEGYLH